MGLLDDLKPHAKKPVPTEIHVERDALVVQWADGRTSRFWLKLLRERCPCAGCVDEWTGRRTLDPAKVPASIAPTAMSEVGRYALQVSWSDGHSTGIYSWDLLSKLHEELAAAGKA